MRQVIPYKLWLGHAGDARNLRGLLAAGIAALVDLAGEEPPAPLVRDLVYCRFPLVDGAGNAPWLLRAAIDTTAGLLRERVPALVACGAGMSRSPAVVAAALARVEGRSLVECLADLSRLGPCDVAAGLWQEVLEVLLLPR
jgi:protein-tyrosine phosphatase